MKEFDYIIIGGGCAGLSLAYELEVHNKLNNKTLAIIEPRLEYKKDKTWSFWKVTSHNFDDCVKKSWKNFSINIPGKINHLECNNYPYQSIDSGLFYEKINIRLKKNKNIFFFKNLDDIDKKNSFIFNSVPEIKKNHLNLWQHFCGIEIETEKNYFDDSIFNLMDFDCEQRESVHFFYTLPYSKNKALVETTWLSRMNDNSQKDYDNQLKNYLENHLNLKDYKISYKEEGAIPLFYPANKEIKSQINIGTAGGMTRLSTGYTFLNIQEHSKYIRKNIENISNVKKYEIHKKYQFLDEIFLRVLDKHPEKMSNIFFDMFRASPKTVIKFLSNKSNFFEDLSIIFKMPKLMFIKALFY
ncbi:lycopene cyclase family protein [Candidatus Pelagibacter communis]|uniref:lycopene cyclase family protein n=1 Tax=Pelagibacter ubique TaxID=198252 RepID=UPI00094C2D0F|nr:lycopene cyclase family protein [Candidatus Pelagibacter ubique]